MKKQFLKQRKCNFVEFCFIHASIPSDGQLFVRITDEDLKYFVPQIRITGKM